MNKNINHKQVLLIELAKSFQLFGDHYMESLFFLLKSRKDLLDDINANFKNVIVIVIGDVLHVYTLEMWL